MQVKGVEREKKESPLALLHYFSFRMLRGHWGGCRNVFLLFSCAALQTVPQPRLAAPALCIAGAVLPPSGRKADCLTETPAVCLISTFRSSGSSSHPGYQQWWVRPKTCLFFLLCYCVSFQLNGGFNQFDWMEAPLLIICFNQMQL